MNKKRLRCIFVDSLYLLWVIGRLLEDLYCKLNWKKHRFMLSLFESVSLPPCYCCSPPPFLKNLFCVLVCFSVHSMNCFKCFNAAATSRHQQRIRQAGVDGIISAAGAAGRRQLLALSSVLSSSIFQFCVSPCTQTFFDKKKNNNLLLLLLLWRLCYP